MDKRTKFYMDFVMPMKARLRNVVVYWLENALDRLDIENCRRYDNAITFRDFLFDDDLFVSDEFNDEQGEW